jgi:hypothetical protein
VVDCVTAWPILLRLHKIAPPAPTEQTITGQAFITVPTTTRVSVVAVASRKVVGESEFYQWMVAVPSGTNKFFLSNDNLLPYDREDFAFGTR